jgi:hypothetical protein
MNVGILEHNPLDQNPGAVHFNFTSLANYGCYGKGLADSQSGHNFSDLCYFNGSITKFRCAEIECC